MEGILQGRRSGPSAGHVTHIYSCTFCAKYPIATHLLERIHDLCAAGDVALCGSGPLYRRKRKQNFKKKKIPALEFATI